MPYTALKILAYLLALSLPVVMLQGASRRMQKSATKASTRRMILVLLVPAAWLVELAGVTLGQCFGECAWYRQHPAGMVTEEDMMALGDYPNVFAGWVLTGWIPVLIGLVLSGRQGRREEGA